MEHSNMPYEQRADLIKQLYSSATKNELPENNDPAPYYFDESTGSYYILTGKSQIERPTVELSLKYFNSILTKYSGKKQSRDDLYKAICCSIAVEAITRMLEDKDPNHILNDSYNSPLNTLPNI